MNLTNALGLPSPIVAAIQNDDYDAGDSDITVTQLIDSPRVVELYRRHAKEITEEVADNIYALLGKSVHRILEDAEASMLTEKRLYTECREWKVSGGYDRLALISGQGFKGILQDYKVASVWEIIFGVKKEKEWQLNLLAELARRNGYKIDKLQNVFILRDWQKSKAKRERDYPQRQVVVVDQPLWSEEDAAWFLECRVQEHQEARHNLPLCSDEDRWKDPDKWAVMKVGRKSALRVLDSKADAEAWCVGQGLGHVYSLPNDVLDDIRDDEIPINLVGGISIEHRPSIPRRCEDYCAVSHLCEQFQKEKASASNHHASIC